MSTFIVAELAGGQAGVYQKSFDKIDTIAAVGTTGVTKAVDVGINKGELVRVMARRTSGAALEDFTVKIFDDVSKNEDNLLFSAAVTGEDRLDVGRSELGRFYNSSAIELYVEIKTATTAGHEFQIRIQGNKVG